jgi:hypothetical protein
VSDVPDAQIIQLFQREKPPAEDSKFWEWGQEFVADGVNNLAAIVDEITTAESEEQLRRCLEELKAEVDRYPV